MSAVAFAKKHWLLLTAGTALGIVGAVAYEKKAHAAQGLGALAAGIVVPIVPGALSISPVIGSTVSFTLPAGATWISVGQDTQTTQKSGNAPLTLTVSDDAALTFVWTSASGATQTTWVSVLPTSNQATVPLQPGATTVAVKSGGSVLLTLPTGATWDSSGPAISPLNPTTTQPTGSQAFNLVMNGGAGTVFAATAKWRDASGNSKSTIVNIAVS